MPNQRPCNSSNRVIRCRVTWLLMASRTPSFDLILTTSTDIFHRPSHCGISGFKPLARQALNVRLKSLIVGALRSLLSMLALEGLLPSYISVDPPGSGYSSQRLGRQIPCRHGSGFEQMKSLDLHQAKPTNPTSRFPREIPCGCSSHETTDLRERLVAHQSLRLCCTS
jgi:hypothetical protein